MTTSNKPTFTRKIALGLGAVIISSMTLAGAAEAKPKFDIDIYFGGPGYGWGGYGGPCHWYLKKYFKTGKWYWKKKYKKCMWMYY